MTSGCVTMFARHPLILQVSSLLHLFTGMWLEPQHSAKLLTTLKLCPIDQYVLGHIFFESFRHLQVQRPQI